MFKGLTMTIESTGEKITLRDEKGFQNFERLRGMMNERDYINLNDDLMDGPDAMGDRYEHKIYEGGEVKEVLTFEYSR